MSGPLIAVCVVAMLALLAAMWLSFELLDPADCTCDDPDCGGGCA